MGQTTDPNGSDTGILGDVIGAITGELPQLTTAITGTPTPQVQIAQLQYLQSLNNQKTWITLGLLALGIVLLPRFLKAA